MCDSNHAACVDLAFGTRAAVRLAPGKTRPRVQSTFRVQRLVRKWAGLRNFVADKSPVVGLDREVPGFFWLVAQGGYGIQTSPALGRVVAALIRGGDVPEDLQSLRVRADNLSPARLH
jgi:D-arginine dehydrogenase